MSNSNLNSRILPQFKNSKTNHCATRVSLFNSIHDVLDCTSSKKIPLIFEIRISMSKFRIDKSVNVQTAQGRSRLLVSLCLNYGINNFYKCATLTKTNENEQIKLQ